MVTPKIADEGRDRASELIVKVALIMLAGTLQRSTLAVGPNVRVLLMGARTFPSAEHFGVVAANFAHRGSAGRAL